VEVFPFEKSFFTLELISLRTRKDEDGIYAMSFHDNAVLNILTNVFGSQASKSQPKRPEVVEFYNKYYHAVDTFNQAILWYQFPHRTTPKKTLLWYLSAYGAGEYSNNL